MKNLGLVLLCLFAVNALGLEGWRKFIQDPDRVELATPPTASWAVKGDEIIVQVTNHMDEVLIYSGHDPAAPQLFFEEMRDGKWVDTSWEWCGTGMELQKLQPKGKNQFRLASNMYKSAYRVYAVFASPDWKRQSLVLIYSTEKMTNLRK